MAAGKVEKNFLNILLVKSIRIINLLFFLILSIVKSKINMHINTLLLDRAVA